MIRFLKRSFREGHATETVAKSCCGNVVFFVFLHFKKKNFLHFSGVQE